MKLKLRFLLPLIITAPIYCKANADCANGTSYKTTITEGHYRTIYKTCKNPAYILTRYTYYDHNNTTEIEKFRTIKIGSPKVLML